MQTYVTLACGGRGASPALVFETVGASLPHDCWPSDRSPGDQQYRVRGARHRMIVVGRDDFLRSTVPLLRFPQEFQCGLLVPRLRDEALEHLAFVIDCTPEPDLRS